MLFRKRNIYPFLVWLMAIAIAPVAIIIGKYARGEGDQLGFVPATYLTVMFYGILLGIIPFAVYYFSFRRMMRSSLSNTAIKFWSLLIALLSINTLFFALGGTKIYSKYYELPLIYSLAILIAGIIFRSEKTTQ